MSKNKISISLISLLGVIVLLLTFQFAVAARPSLADTEEKTLQTIKLYENDGDYSNGSYFKQKNDAYGWLNGSGNAAIDKSHNFSLDSKLQRAMQNGYLNITVTAQFGSGAESVFLGEDNPDDVTMTITDANGNSLASTSNRIDGVESHSLQITQASSQYTVSFAARLFVNNNALRSRTIMQIKEPTVTISTTDVTAPEIGSFITDSDNIWTQSKVLSFTVTDNEAGIDRVEINGENVTLQFNDDSQNSATVNYTVTEDNKDYSITVYDNVGNSYSEVYHSSYIDTLAPKLDVDLVEGTEFGEFEFTFNASIDNSNKQADESYYYTYDGTSAKTSDTRKVLQNGVNPIIVSTNGAYSLNIYACDTAGNEYEMTRNFAVNGAYYYTISTTLLGNTQSATLNEQGDNSQLNNTISYEIAPTLEQNGTTFLIYQVLINGEIVDVDKIEFVFDKTYIVELRYREIVSIDMTTLYAYTGTEIALDYTANCAQNLITWTISQNGNNAELKSAGKYTISYNVDNADFTGSGQFDVEIQKPVNVTVNKTEYEYSPDTFMLDYTIDSGIDYLLKFTNSAGIEIDYITAITEPLDAGEYTYTLTLNGDYYIAGQPLGTKQISGKFTILPKNIALEEYDETVVYSGSDFVFENPYAYEVRAEFFQNGKAVTPKNVGKYDVTITITQPNYIGSTTGTLEITKKEVTLTANAASSVYGEQFSTLSYTQNGFADGENFEFTLTCDYKQEVGEYTIDFVRQELENYTIIYVTAKYTITPRTATVTVTAGQGKEYGEDDTEFAYTVENVLDGDELNIRLIRQQGEDAGSYAITLAGYNNKNYTISFIGDNYRISPRTLVLSADNISMVYGETEPELTYTILFGEVVGADDLGIVLSRESGENVGRYAITLNAESSNPNYDITFITGYLTITKADITVIANETSKEYGETDPELTYTISGASEVTFTGALSRTWGENIGEYEITLGTLNNPNFNISFISAKFTIMRANITITANSVSKTYGDTDGVLTWAADRNVSIADFSGSLIRESGENVGTYAITQGSLTSDFYNITFVAGKFTILPRTVIVNFSNLSKVYGTPDPEIIYRTSGVLAGDNLEISVSRAAGENAGSYEYRVTTTNANYTLVVIPAGLTIEKADAVITANNQTFVYDGTEKNIVASLNTEGILNYRITSAGESVDKILNAGQYQVVITFDGNQNYNAASRTITVIVNKADVSISIIKNIFVVNGNMQEPVINSPIPFTFAWDDITTIAEVGVHEYTIVFNDANYNSIRGKMTILDKPANSTDGGSVEFESGDVDNENVDLSIEKTDDNKTAQNATDMQVDSTYEIKYNQSSNATIKVELDYVADDYTNVFVYAYNEKGEAMVLPYQVIDGKIVFSVAADNMKFAIVKQVTGISIVTIGFIVILAGLITLGVVRHHNKKKKKIILKVS